MQRNILTSGFRRFQEFVGMGCRNNRERSQISPARECNGSQLSVHRGIVGPNFAANDSAFDDDVETCPICLEALLPCAETTVVNSTLPCGHAFHMQCIHNLRSSRAPQSCPLCRALLPPSAEELFEIALRRYHTVSDSRRLVIGENDDSWRTLTQEECSEMKEIAELFTMAAKLGHAEAQLNLGYLYSRGRGIEQSDELAVRYYRMGAEQGGGYVKAMLNLGIMFALGRGVEQDDSEACRWFFRAAEKGFDRAQHKLGIMLKQGRGIQQSDEMACVWFSKAASQNLAESQFSLGTMYKQGRGVERDTAKAVHWYRKASAQGNINAMRCLGFMYRDGQGVMQSDNEALYWLKKAAYLGDASAQAFLGQLFLLEKRGEQAASGKHAVRESDVEEWSRKSDRQDDQAKPVYFSVQEF